MNKVNYNDLFQLKKNKKRGSSYLYRQSYMRNLVFFDFETTCDPDNDIFTKKQVNNENSRDQVAFCISFKREF